MSIFSSALSSDALIAPGGVRVVFKSMSDISHIHTFSSLVVRGRRSLLTFTLPLLLIRLSVLTPLLHPYCMTSISTMLFTSTYTV